MKTSVNFWDALFGEKSTLEIPSPDGDVKKVKVTKKWKESACTCDWGNGHMCIF